MTGTWRVKVHTDPKAAPIAQAAFLVEDFVPERLELKLATQAEALSVGQLGLIEVAGRYLYGPPAVGLAVEGEIAVKASSKDLPGFPGYRFGLADEQFSPVRKPLEGLPATGADGKAVVAVGLPVFAKTGLPLDAHVIIRLRESGGRTIERTMTLPVDPRSARIGIKPLFKGEVGDGETARFEAVLVGADGKAAPAKGLNWQLLRLDRRWQWYSRGGSWAYEATTSTRRVAAGAVDAEPGAPARIEARPDWGRYRLEVSDGSGLVSSVVFNAGGGPGPRPASAPRTAPITRLTWLRASAAVASRVARSATPTVSRSCAATVPRSLSSSRRRTYTGCARSRCIRRRA
jgi:uncharacterized protein YfaS (alpha-2-macroglobulin family)